MNEITVEDYKIFYSDGKETHLDTTLNINKDYRQLVFQEGLFRSLTFPNTRERVIISLLRDFQGEKKTPQIGARQNTCAYLEEEKTIF